MKRVAILGTWKNIQGDIADDAEQFARQVIQQGHRIITGGSPGVDYVVVQESLRRQPGADNLEVLLPVPLDIYKSHLMKSAVRNVITTKESDDIIRQLSHLRLVNKTTLKAMKQTAFSNEALIARNQAIADIADQLIVFQINDSADAEAAIERARKRDIPVRIMHYYR